MGWRAFLGLQLLICLAFVASAQTAPAAPETAPAPAVKAFDVDMGTRIPLSMINSVSTKHSVPGERVYLETVFPVVINGRIVIPTGSYVMGTITNVQRPGRVKGRGEFYLRFDSLTLPNGVTRAGIGAAAGAAAGLVAVLVTRGPDAVLAKGTTVEMVLDHNIHFDDSELDFSSAAPRRSVGEGGGPLPSKKAQATTRRWPL
jgi:hypothetical protein